MSSRNETFTSKREKIGVVSADLFYCQELTLITIIIVLVIVQPIIVKHKRKSFNGNYSNKFDFVTSLQWRRSGGAGEPWPPQILLQGH